ncbi:N-formylglutamate amidohydrolase [Sphingomonas sp.]|uniref:N-formylglutamate amidohydrolase n=1 Tax=Sphingomonas sp. TaxID=28214 RepID=UPI003B00A1BD
MGDDFPREMLRLLSCDDPQPVGNVNLSGRSRFLLVGDHAGDAIPQALGMLGLRAADLARHIAVDIGTRALGEALAHRLDATFIHQRFSRLVIDCNRDPARADAIPETSDGTPVPGNAAIGAAERAVRTREIHAPYHAAIAAELERRRAVGRATILVSLHSFTPRLAGGAERPWHLGLLHDGRADGFALALLASLSQDDRIVVGDNEPYRMDATDYTVPTHAFLASVPYVELEVRQDLIARREDMLEWAERIAVAAEASQTRAAPRNRCCCH